jgi:hypothetical protein
VLIVAQGSPDRRGAGGRHGHFAPARWRVDGRNLPEVMVSGEGLKRDPPEVLVTLVHEATHGVCHARGIVDTSRQGRYHNKKFAAVAKELGLVQREPGTDAERALVASHGYTLCALDPAVDWAPHLARLSALGKLHRWDEPIPAAAAESKARNGHACKCECVPPRLIRVHVSTFDEGPIMCRVCGADFEPEEE